MTTPTAAAARPQPPELGAQPEPVATAKGPGKAQQAFRRGLPALAQREGADRPVPRGHGEEVAVDGEAEPVVVKLGPCGSPNTKGRRDKLTADHLAALAKLGACWA